MRVLLVSGAGPVIKNHQYLVGSLLDPADEAAQVRYDRLWPGLRLDRLVHRDGTRDHQLLRPRRYAGAPSDHVHPACGAGAGRRRARLARHRRHLGRPRRGTGPVRRGPAVDDVPVGVGVGSLVRSVDWLAARWPDAVLVLGGQYSNLKYARILRNCPAVDYVVRGDGGLALPALLAALDRRGDGFRRGAQPRRPGRGRPAAVGPADLRRRSLGLARTRTTVDRSNWRR